MNTSITRRRFAAGLAAPLLLAADPRAFDQAKGELPYWSALSSERSVEDWTMEGTGRVVFNDGWMEMWSLGEQMHHVYWCPETFPAGFAAEWELQNLHPEAGLCIVSSAPPGSMGKTPCTRLCRPVTGRFRNTTTAH